MGRSDWSNVINITTTTDAASRAAGIDSLPNAQRIISAHSGGGAALGYAVMRHQSGAGMRADQVFLMDCCYGAANGWSASRAAEVWARHASSTAKAIYIDGGGSNDDKPGDRIRKIIGARYSEVRAPDHYSAVRDYLAKSL